MPANCYLWTIAETEAEARAKISKACHQDPEELVITKKVPNQITEWVFNMEADLPPEPEYGMLHDLDGICPPEFRYLPNLPIELIR